MAGSLDYPLWIARFVFFIVPSAFSSVYLERMFSSVGRVSRLSLVDCPFRFFFIVPSVFSSVYLERMFSNVGRVSGLSLVDCLFRFLLCLFSFVSS